MAPVRRPAPTAPPVEGVSFGDLGMYAAGGGLPEGDYALEFTVQMYQAQDKTGASRGPARLGVMITASSLTDPAAEPRMQFYSMGSQADKSFAPNPETGKGVVLVPGGPASTFNNSTNWAIFLKSLYDCGLPVGIFTNDLTALDGIWAHLTNIPEPEERKGFQSKTGEAAEERRPGTIAVVSEIKEDGKPWEGTGGVPQAEAPTPAPAARVLPRKALAPKAAPVAAKTAAPAAPARPAPRAGARPAAPTAPTEMSEEDVATAAANGIAAVLEKAENANGCTKLLLRTGTFKAVSAADGEDMANVVLETFFGSDANLNLVLEPMGYISAAGQIKVVA